MKNLSPTELKRSFLLNDLGSSQYRGIKARFFYRNYIEQELNALLKHLSIKKVDNSLEV